MLELQNKGFFSKEYVALENGIIIAELSREIWRAKAEMTCQGRMLKLKRYGKLKSTYLLYEGDTTIVEVKTSDIKSSKFTFRHSGKDYELVNKAWYSEILLVKSENEIIGTIIPKSLFSCNAIIELPDYLPLALKVFIAWVGMVHWEDSATFGATGAIV